MPLTASMNTRLNAATKNLFIPFLLAGDWGWNINDNPLSVANAAFTCSRSANFPSSDSTLAGFRAIFTDLESGGQTSRNSAWAHGELVGLQASINAYNGRNPAATLSWITYFQIAEFDPAQSIGGVAGDPTNLGFGDICQFGNRSWTGDYPGHARGLYGGTDLVTLFANNKKGGGRLCIQTSCNGVGTSVLTADQVYQDLRSCIDPTYVGLNGSLNLDCFYIYYSGNTCANVLNALTLVRGGGGGGGVIPRAWVTRTQKPTRNTIVGGGAPRVWAARDPG